MFWERFFEEKVISDTFVSIVQQSTINRDIFNFRIKNLNNNNNNVLLENLNNKKF